MPRRYLTVKVADHDVSAALIVEAHVTAYFCDLTCLIP